jgi:hypothetical protein
MDKSVHYNYAATEGKKERYNIFGFSYNELKMIYTGRINFIPSGYWKYEVYEVAWQGTVTISDGNAPITETEVLFPPADDKGITQGISNKRKNVCC